MITVSTLSIDQVIASIRQAGYPVFEKGDFNINTFGLRSDNARCNQFDDVLTSFYKVGGKWQFFAYRATTDPGATYLKKPMRATGTMILAPGYYPKAYMLAHHKNLPALRQVGMLKVYRDNDKDEVLEMDPRTLESGTDQCCNIHYSKGEGEIQLIGPWSAGCQVLAYGHTSRKYTEFLNHYRQAIKVWPNSFSYGLLTENQLIR